MASPLRLLQALFQAYASGLDARDGASTCVFQLDGNLGGLLRTVRHRDNALPH